MKFFDTHAHLPMLAHAPQAEILSRAAQAGVTQMVSVATELANWDSSRQAAIDNADVYYTLGLHPHEAHDWAQCESKLQSLFAQGVPEKCVGIGETGLDFFYNHADRSTQLHAFESQLRFAKQFELPIIIHCRDAFKDLFEIIARVGLGKGGGVMHCFTGTTPDAKAAIDLGLCISFSGILTFKNAEPLREAAKALPLESIVLETDCPYLAPIPNRGKPNEPSYLPYTALCLAETRGVQLEAIAEATTATANQLFKLA